jgi:hypothetical protein
MHRFNPTEMTTKLKRYIPSIVLLSLVVLCSCQDDFLEIIPKGSQVAVTTADYALLMNAPNLYNHGPAGGLREFVLMGDEVAAEADFFGNQSRPFSPLAFQWADVIFNNNELPLDLQDQTGEIYTLNKVINEVMASQNGTEAEKTSIQAEAKVRRAFVNFLWVNSYGKPYEASSATTDPAFPIITEASIAATTFKRASVQEMYDFIIKDLKEAIAVLPAQNIVLTRASRASASALLGKVYLFMGRFTDALPYLEAALTDVATSPIPVHLHDYNVALGPGGSFLPIDSYVGPANGPGNIFNDFTESIQANTFTGGPYDGNPFENNGLVLTPDAAALYGASDLRLLLYTDMNTDGTPNSGGRIRKYGVTYIKFGMQLSELYLLLAEVRARTNDLAGAVADVETLRKHRMPEADAAVPPAIAADQTALIKFIIDERIREFAMEGYRWFDMRRLSVDPIFTGMAFTHTLYSASGNTTYTLRQPERLVLQIPLLYINTNPGMINNP